MVAPLRIIEESASACRKAAGVPVRPPRGWGRRLPEAKTAN